MNRPLDIYLETLSKGEMQKTASREAHKDSSFNDLAKAAGIKLAESVCGKCGSQMEKDGSIYKCGCGMMKKSSVQKIAMGEPEYSTEPGWWRGSQGAAHAMSGKPGMLHLNKPEVMKKLLGGQLKGGLTGSGIGAGLGAGIGALVGKKNRLAGAGLGSLLGGASGGLAGQSIGNEIALRDYLKSKGIRRTGAVIPSHAFTQEAAEEFLPQKEASVSLYKIASAYEEFQGDLEKVAAHLESKGMEKDAILGALAKYAPKLMQAGRQTAKGATKSFGAAKESLKASKPGQLLQQAGQMNVGGKTLAERGGQAADWMKANPMKSTALGAAGGYGASKVASQELLEVGDAAGKLLAKTAQGVPVDELRESIEEAQSREDIPGRAKRWQIGGGAAGGLGGAGVGALAGRGIPRMFGSSPKGQLIGAGLGAVAGAAGGGALGAWQGKQHGAEEAGADRAISLLRALRAHRAGAQSGYGSGLQRGYSYGRGYGGQGAAK